MDNQQERLLCDMNWLAGIMEGEGWFSMCKTTAKYKDTKIQRYYATCGMCNTDRKIIEEFERILTFIKIKFKTYHRKPRIQGSKESWQLHIVSMDHCADFIKVISPYLRGEKKQKANALLDFCVMRKNKIKGFCGVSYDEEDHENYSKFLLA